MDQKPSPHYIMKLRIIKGLTNVYSGWGLGSLMWVHVITSEVIETWLCVCVCVLREYAANSGALVS